MNTRPQVTFLHMDTSPAVEQRIRDEAARLDRYFERIVSCRVTIEAPHKNRLHDGGYHIRIEIGVPGNDLVVTHDAARHCSTAPEEDGRWTKELEPQPRSHDVNTAIRDAFAAARRKLEDYSRRLRGDVKHHATRGEEQGIPV